MNIHTLEIDLSNDYSRELKEEALIHEIVHAISTINVLELEETQVAPLAALLHQFIKQVEE